MAVHWAWWVLAAAAVALAGAGVWRRRVAVRWGLGGAGAAGVCVALVTMPQPWASDAELLGQLPPQTSQGGAFRTSGACRACHPAEDASWRQTFHRTMTQAAGPASIKAPFDGRRLTDAGRTFVVRREGEAFVADLMDGATVKQQWRVVMITGSHQLQAYWVRTAKGNLIQFPWVYVIRDGVWLPNDASFLQPEPEPSETVFRSYYWSSNCVFCHTTAPVEASASTAFTETAVAELGIACEVCHGPAADHIARHQNPARRYLDHLADAPDPTIVNPGRLDHERASTVCARCHTAFPASNDEDSSGVNIQPGDRFADHVNLGLLADVYDDGVAQLEADERTEGEEEVVGTLWPDYTVRVAGREYNGMVMSQCTIRGGMSCLSCHQLHGGAPNKLLAPDKVGAEGCRPCHAEHFDQLAAHTHHAPGSPGSDCLGCHMPYASYGLLGATRSHRIDSPRATGVDTRDRPNACNLCHLDRTLAWTAVQLETWYGRPAPALDREHHRTAVGVLWLGRGDAVQRTIAVWHLGQPAVQAASDVRALVPFAAPLLNDDYAATRYVAARALARVPGFEGTPLAPMAAPNVRRARVEAVLSRWRREGPSVGRSELMQREDGSLDGAQVERLEAARDRWPASITE